MDLLQSPMAVALLEEISDQFGPATTSKSTKFDQFFWLEATRATGPNGKLTITPTYARADTPIGPPPVRICNLVLQGGGTLGLAHAGFVTGLEHAGIRFAGLAGTSAGSILAMGIAAIRGGDLTQETYRKLVAITEAVPMDYFIDGPRPIRMLIKRALQGHAIYLPQHWGGIIAALKRLRDRRGLNHGSAFEHWFESVMQELDCATIDDLYDAMGHIWADLDDLTRLRPHGPSADPVLRNPGLTNPSLVQRPGVALLQLMTMAMPVGLKFKLPEDLYYLSPDYEMTSPARLVRTSMAIPAFFEPVVMRTNRVTWGERVRAELGGLLSAAQRQQFEALDELVFLDGGMMSNLPSDSFRELMPEMPTIVVPLVGGGQSKEITRRRRMADLGSDIAACAGAVRLQRDREIWSQNTALRAAFDQAEQANEAVRSGARPARQFPVAIAPIDTGDANWLNFVMSAGEKASLFEAGLKRARDLLTDIKKGVSV